MTDAPGSPGSRFEILRCRACGDTFPVDDAAAACPTCGGGDLQPADEPLL